MNFNDTLQRLESLNKHVTEGETPRVKLDANENLFLPQELMRRYLREAADRSDSRLYPGSEAEELRETIAKAIGVDANQIVLGGGGDQLINLLTTSLLREGEGLLSLTPTFSMYPNAASIRGLEYQEFPMSPELTFNPNELLASVKDNTKMIEVVNPNNPTGVQFDETLMKRMVRGFNGPILIDEAYVEYGRYSLVSLCKEYGNLIVLRTFSKAYGLAGLRLGYLVTGPRLASALQGVQDPYPASGVAIQMGLRILNEKQLVEDAVEQLRKERGWLSSELSKILGVSLILSDASFITFRTSLESSKVWVKLLRRGVAVRLVRDIPGLGDCLRVTVAPHQLLEEFLKCLKEMIV